MSSNPIHDLSLHSGERQIASTYKDIRADHRYRYEWADKLLPLQGFGLDAFCGNGYGTWLLSKSRMVWGIDGSADAIRLAEQAYRTSRAFFSTGYYPFELPKNAFDFIVSLESVEHIENGEEFFQDLVQSLKPGGRIVFSTPCEELLPHACTGNHFHYKHYTFKEAMALASSNDLKILDWAGQDTYSFLPNGMQGHLLPDEAMKVKVKEIGQFLMFCCIKKQSTALGKIRAWVGL